MKFHFANRFEAEKIQCSVRCNLSGSFTLFAKANIAQSTGA